MLLFCLTSRKAPISFCTTLCMDEGASLWRNTLVMLRTTSNTIVLVCSDCCNKIPQTEWLKQQTFISCSSRGWEVQIKVLAVSVLDEGSLPGLQMATFLLCPHMAEKDSSGVSLSSYKGTNPITGVPLPWPHLNLIYSQRLHLWMPSHWRLNI